MSTHYDENMNSSLKNLLGHILVGRHGISEQQFEQAFYDENIAWSLQKKVLSQGGAILACGGVVSQQTVLKPVSMFEALKLVSGVRQPLGHLLLESGLIAQEQLDQALEVQQQTGEQIGRVFVRLGMLEVPVIDGALKSQQQMEKRAVPVPAAIRIGEILVAGGHLTREQLNDSIQHQKNSDKKLGEILVEKGYVKQRHIEHSIRLQQMLVTAALGTVISISSVDKSEAGSLGNVSTATLQVSATIKPSAQVKVLYQNPQIDITSKDIAQGYIEIPNASRIEVRNNCPSGYLLTIENQGGPFRNIFVSGLGNEIQLQGNSGWILMSYAPMPKTLDVSFRMTLSADARPGPYPWPFQLSAMVI